jgi:hypothetical protein
MPNTARLLQRPTPITDCSQPGLCLPDSTQHSQSLRYTRAELPPSRVTPSQDCAADLRPGESRTIAGYSTPKSSYLRQAYFSVDARFSSRGLPPARLDRMASQHRVGSPSLEAARRWVATSQALDHLARSGVRTQKKRRDRLIALATQRVEQGWVIGYGDEVWWSRLAQPRMHSWCDNGQPLRLQEFEAKANKDDPDPKALCCYGLLRADTGKVWLRFVDGRPVGHVTTAWLEWVCERLATEGKRVLVLIWDNATWHVSREVRNWLRNHNRCALADRREGNAGIQIVPCFLPTKSPWLNNIEPKWIHGKRAVTEPGRKLAAQELTDRIYAYFDSDHVEHLKQNVS